MLLVALPCLAASPVPPGTGGRWLVAQDEVLKVPPLPRCTVDEGVLHDQLRVVFENEMLWTRMVAVGVLHDLKGHDVYIKRLMTNYESFEDALEPFYGEDAASVGRLRGYTTNHPREVAGRDSEIAVDGNACP